ncbi:hypothetical protein [Campylobacter sp. RM16704]|uniref:hypothetical protein n=1 Tax=Campylobacter sp. RM16704 TaxID=1500960 RepID=UPI0005803D26|nr:hypothetical protein [Campylobacter sp. RM16704]AJC86241.1 hypothetical protein CAQ16704_0780 [Campylobacter sp. RM16704]
MRKLIYILKKIFDFSEEILSNLTSREYKLALILSFIFGFFMVYYSTFSFFENKEIFLNNKLHSLQTQIKTYNNLPSYQYENNNSLEFDFNSFKEINQDYQDLLNHIEKKLASIKAKSIQIQTQHYKDKYFTYYELNLNFIGDFQSLMILLQELNKNIMVNKMKLEKNENKLKISLNLIFTLA